MGFQQVPKVFRAIFSNQDEQSADTQQPSIEARGTCQKRPDRGREGCETGEEEIQKRDLL